MCSESFFLPGSSFVLDYELTTWLHSHAWDYSLIRWIIGGGEEVRVRWNRKLHNEHHTCWDNHSFLSLHININFVLLNLFPRWGEEKVQNGAHIKYWWANEGSYAYLIDSRPYPASLVACWSPLLPSYQLVHPLLREAADGCTLLK